MCDFRKENTLQNLNYWNVDLQEAYYSTIEANKRYKSLKNKNLLPSVMSKSIVQDSL